MPKIGERKTRTSYVEATDIASIIGLTGSMITSTAIGSAALSKLTTGLASRLKVASFLLGNDFAQKVLSLLKNKTLSKYKVKFITTEMYTKERVFDTHEWIDAYMWKHLSTKISLVRK